MRELTEAEKDTMKSAMAKTIDARDNPFTAFRLGFTAGFEAQDSRIALLESRIAELESVLKLMELEVE